MFQCEGEVLAHPHARLDLQSNTGETTTDKTKKGQNKTGGKMNKTKVTSGGDGQEKSHTHILAKQKPTVSSALLVQYSMEGRCSNTVHYRRPPRPLSLPRPPKRTKNSPTLCCPTLVTLSTHTQYAPQHNTTKQNTLTTSTLNSRPTNTTHPPT